MAEPEKFLMRTVGGPFPGTRVVPEDKFPWPLPERLDDPEGRGEYVKANESGLPPQEPGSHVMRGAEYHWEPKTWDGFDTQPEVEPLELSETDIQRAVSDASE